MKRTPRRTSLLNDAEFSALYPTHSTQRLMDLTGQCASTVLKRARRLGLRKTPERLIQSHREAMTREQRSIAMMGHVVSVETRAKLSTTLRGRTVTWGRKSAATRRANASLRGVSMRSQTYRRNRCNRREYRLWRDAVLERDGYTCQDCGHIFAKRERGLHAHHIKFFALHSDLRLVVDNGIALCRDCHWRRHGRMPPVEKMITCGCGCGIRFPLYNKWGYRRHVLPAHRGRYRNQVTPQNYRRSPSP